MVARWIPDPKVASSILVAFTSFCRKQEELRAYSYPYLDQILCNTLFFCIFDLNTAENTLQLCVTVDFYPRIK